MFANMDKTIIVCLIVIGFIEATKFDKLFCNTQNDPSGKRSCSSALWDDSTETTSECYMFFRENDSKRVSEPKECDAVSFDAVGDWQNADLGRVKLRAFPEERSTGINVTFSDIKWTSMFMRFKEKDGHNLQNLCRKFTISPTPVPPEKELFYDCLWSTSLGQREFEFEFQASKSSITSIGRYYFKVPADNNLNPTNARLNESELFMYLDLTKQHLVKLHLQTARDRFNIGPENYVVTAHSNTSGYITETILKPLPELVEDDEITYHFETYGRKGSYYFTAKINHVNCTKEQGCYVSKSPSINIRASPYRDVVLIAIAGCGAVVLAVLSFLYFLWRIRINSLKAPRPTVMLMFSPKTAKHNLAVVEFARFLRKFCHVQALVDELDIPFTKSKDPYVWCNDAFSRANAIMVVASPPVACSSYKRIYVDVDNLSLTLLKEKMADKKREMKFLSVVLPHCVKNEVVLPEEAKNLRRYYLPSDLTAMLTYVHTGSTNFYRKFCISELFKAGSSEIKSRESDFVKAVNEAKSEVRNRVERCNRWSSAPTDREAGPLLMSRLVSIDMPRDTADDNDDDDGDRLLWPAIRNSPQIDLMFPGPIHDLNLDGAEGAAQADNSTVRRPVGSGVDLNALDL